MFSRRKLIRVSGGRHKGLSALTRSPGWDSVPQQWQLCCDDQTCSRRQIMSRLPPDSALSVAVATRDAELVRLAVMAQEQATRRLATLRAAEDRGGHLQDVLSKQALQSTREAN